MAQHFQRRQFLQTALAAGTAAPALQLLARKPAQAAAPRSPNEKLNIGCIGVGGRGAANVDGVAGENIVALCDIDGLRLDAAAAKFPRAARFTDFRRMLDRDDLDAVVVSTPDHTHAPPVVSALRKGLDVYCEKPLAHSVHEVREMRKAARQADAVTQMGTQIHALNNYRRVVELVQSGTIGQVRRVHVWKANTVEPQRRGTDGTPPDHVDYDLWIGPAPMRPFDESHFHYNWRYWFDFGGGTLADFGCHYIDLPYWALRLGAPETIEAKGEKTHGGDNAPPNNLRVDYRFPARRGFAEVHLTWYHGDSRSAWAESYAKNDGVLFEGDDGRLLADYTTHKVFHEAGGHDVNRPAAWIPDSLGHHQEWISACKSRGGTTCNFEYSGQLAETVLLGNVSYRAGGKRLQWNSDTLSADNCPETASYIRRAYRPPWSL